ncbi:MAG: FAD-dependent oxidoreductase [Candidatus Caldarchaeum sp.]
MQLDVAVVGGGPAGLLAAREVAGKGLRVAVFEEDVVIGRPEKCAGLYSVEGMRRLGLPLDAPYVQNRVRGAVFVSPSGMSFEVDAGRDVALVCNRERLEQYIAEQAVVNGAELLLGEHVSEARLSNGRVFIKTSTKTARPQHLIIAEGRQATTARQIFTNIHLGTWLPIVQLQISNHGQDPDKVYLYFRKYLPEYFGYLVPVDEKIGKLGVAASKFPDILATKLMSELFPRSKLLGVSSSSIYVGKPAQSFRKGPVMLVGDVAGQTKATTGGGVITGGLASIAAARYAAGEATYEKALASLLRELNRTYLIRRLYERMSPVMLDRLFKAVRESGVDVKLGRMGDMDRHMASAVRVLSGRAGVKLAFHLAKSMLAE